MLKRLVDAMKDYKDALEAAEREEIHGGEGEVMKEWQELILYGIALLLLVGILERLTQIRDAIRENYKEALRKAFEKEYIVVTPQEKVIEPCKCSHAKSQHASVSEIEGVKMTHCKVPNCPCLKYQPKRGPWPGEVKV